MEVKSFNWCPTFNEFQEAVSKDLIGVNIMDQQFSWLYENILPFSLFGVFSYRKRLVQAMAANEETFKAVHGKGIDIMLYKSAS